MRLYTAHYESGYTTEIIAKSLLSAKQQATKLASYDGGSYSLHCRTTGRIWQRKQWQGFNAWGWYSWERTL